MAELLALHRDVVVAAPTRPAIVAKQATTTVPIVFAQVADPIRRAAETRLPLFSLSSEFPAAGGLQSFGPKMVDVYRRAAQ